MTPDLDPSALAGLVVGAQAGDTHALSELLDRLAPYVARLCAPVALDDAPDATQEALIAILRGVRTVRDPRALLGWVRTVTLHEAVRVARRRSHCVVAELESLPASGDPQLAHDVGDVLTRLAPEHRAVLVLRDLEGFDEGAAARLLDVPVGTVKSRLHRARRSFKREWTR